MDEIAKALTEYLTRQYGAGWNIQTQIYANTNMIEVYYEDDHLFSLVYDPDEKDWLIGTNGLPLSFTVSLYAFVQPLAEIYLSTSDNIIPFPTDQRPPKIQFVNNLETFFTITDDAPNND